VRKYLAATLAAIVGLAVVALVAMPAQAKKPRTTITDTVVALSGSSGFDADPSDFDILREAVVATGLDDKLAGRRQLTVFAPNDQAFLDLTGASSEQQAFEQVAGLGLEAVADVLAYHVAPGRREAASVVDAKRVRTLQGGFLTKAPGSTTLVDALRREANIVGPDAALVSNGVVHVIDAVVLPYAP
jgi:uncharacterized surface protein with fasciclin (FAS1) repeats